MLVREGVQVDLRFHGVDSYYHDGACHWTVMVGVHSFGVATCHVKRPSGRQIRKLVKQAKLKKKELFS